MKFLSVLIFSLFVQLAQAETPAPDTHMNLDDDPPPRIVEDQLTAKSEPVVKTKPEPVLLDFEWKKSEALENVLEERLKRVVIGAGYTPEKFKSSVVVLYAKGDPFSDPPPVEDPNKKEEKDSKVVPYSDPGLEFAELKAVPLDIDQLIAKFKSDEESDRKIASALRPKGDDIALINGKLPDIEDRYDITLVSMNVTLDPASVEPKIAAERAKALEDYIRAAFTPAFGKRFIIQVKPLPIIEPFWTQFLEWILRFGSYLMALIVATAVILLAYVWRRVAQRRTPQELRFNYNKKIEGADAHKRDGVELDKDGKPTSGKPGSDPESQKNGGGGGQPGMSEINFSKNGKNDEHSDKNDARLMREIARLESQIVEIVKPNPVLSRLMIQDFLRTEYHTEKNDEAMLRVALMLEILSKNKIKAEKLNVKPEILREFHNIRTKLAQVSLADKVKIYEEAYWALVAFSFLSEGDQAFPPFHFLEMLEDSKIAILLSSETPELQAAILLGMSEKKSAQVMEKLSPMDRQNIFEIMCQSHEPNLEELKELAERIKAKAAPLFAVQNIPSSAAEGVAAIGMLLGRLDFKAQFESLKNMAPEIKDQVRRQSFFAAMIDEAKTEFLATLFTDRATDVSKAIMAAFGEQFKQKVLEVLPPMQKRMLETARLNEVSPATVLKTMEEIQLEVRAKIDAKKLSLDEIFDLSKASAPIKRSAPPRLEAA